MKIIKELSAFILAACLLPFHSAMAGGAWGKKEGSFFAHLGYHALNTDRFFGRDGELVSLSTYKRHTASFYGEYGIRNELTAVLSAPIFIYHSISSRSATGIGDPHLEMHYRFNKNGVPLALGLGMGIPLGDEDRSDSLNTGDGEFDFLCKLFAAKVLWEGRIALTGELGYHARTEDYTDDWHFLAKAALQIRRSLWLSALLRGQHLIGKPDAEKINPYAGFGEGVEYLSPGAELFFPFLKRFHASFGAYTAFPGRARNIAARSYLVYGFGASF